MYVFHDIDFVVQNYCRLEGIRMIDKPMKNAR